MCISDSKYALHLVPSGILNPECLCVVGNGVVVHIPSMFNELEALEKVRNFPNHHVPPP